MDKIILATTLSALMAAHSLPAHGREAASVRRPGKPDTARSHRVASGQPARPVASPAVAQSA